MPEGVALDGDFVDDGVDDSPMNDVYYDFITVAAAPSTISAPEPSAPTALTVRRGSGVSGGSPAGRLLAATDTRSEEVTCRRGY